MKGKIIFILVLFISFSLVFLIFYSLIPREAKIEVSYRMVEDDPNVDSRISSSYILRNDLIIGYSSDSKPRIEGLSSDRYRIEDKRIVVYDYKAEYFRLVFGKTSDIYEFGVRTLEMVLPHLEELKIKEVNSTTHAFKTLSNDVIEIGIVKYSPAMPYLKLNRWEGESSLKVEIPYAEEKLPILRENRLRYSSDKTDIEIYPSYPREIEGRIINELGGVEFDVVLKERPSNNKFEFPIKTKNLKFYYQPPLNKEISETFCNATHCWDENNTITTYRPENVVGSYAVYHSYKMNNEYKTGKAFHIYRPKIIDRNGDWTWANFSIDEEKRTLTVSINQSWLDKAEYPVTIDPSFGYETKGGTKVTTGDVIRGSYFTSPESGNAESITAWIEYGSASGYTAYSRCALYRKSDGSLVATTKEHAEGIPKYSSYDKEVTFNFSGTVSISNIDYYLVLWSKYHEDIIYGTEDSPKLYYDSDSGIGGYDSETYNSFPDPWVPISEDRKYSIYANYTAGVAGPSSGFVSHNTTIQNKPCLFTSKWTKGDNNLSTAIFSTNNTGTWQNETVWSNENVAEKWANVTKTLNSTLGMIVGYRFYSNDTSNNWGDSGIRTLTIWQSGTLADDVTGTGAVRLPGQLKTFYSQGLYWGFYSDEIGSQVAYIYYRTSSDGVSWSKKESIARIFCCGAYFDTFLEGSSTLHVTYILKDDWNIYYRKGTLNTNGTISWITDAQLAVDGTTGGGYVDVNDQSITVDSDGYPWIAWVDAVANSTKVTRSSLNNGTWSTTSGFPKTLNTQNQRGGCYPIALNMSNGNIYVVYAFSADGSASWGTDESIVYGRYWNGSAFESEESASTSYVDIGYFARISATSFNNDIHLTFLSNTSDIIYVKRTWGSGWGSETTLQTSASGSSPVISVDPSTEDLYVFWAGNPTADHIYYRKYDNSTGEWESMVDWKDESAFGMTRKDDITCTHQAYDNKIPLLIELGSSEPYMIKHLSFLVEDTTPPTYSKNATNTTIAGAVVNFSIVIHDDTAVDSYIFSTNNTGTWVNASAVATGKSTSETAYNITTLNSTVGALVQWKFYANDTSNNWNASDTYSFVTTIVYPFYYKISGYALDLQTGLLIPSGTVTAIIKESGENATSSFTNGYYEFYLGSSIDSSKNKFTVGIIIISSDGKTSYNFMIIGSGSFAPQTQKCSVKQWHFQGKATDPETGQIMSSGQVTVSVKGTNYVNTTTFSNGIWEIYISPCLISGGLYTFEFSLVSGDRKSYMFLNQVAK